MIAGRAYDVLKATAREVLKIRTTGDERISARQPWHLNPPSGDGRRADGQPRATIMSHAPQPPRHAQASRPGDANAGGPNVLEGLAKGTNC